jgi:hypothetical protein
VISVAIDAGPLATTHAAISTRVSGVATGTQSSRSTPPRSSSLGPLSRRSFTGRIGRSSVALVLIRGTSE